MKIMWLRLGQIAVAVVFCAGTVLSQVKSSSRPQALSSKAGERMAEEAREHSAEQSGAERAGQAGSLRPHEAQEKDDHESVLERERWFYGQRAFPSGTIPKGARLHAWQQRERMRMAEEQARQNMANGSAASGNAGLAAPGSIPAFSGAQWTFLGPAPTDTPYIYPMTSGRVTALAVDPRNSSTVYAGGAQGGVWKTTDGGAHWTPLTDSQPSLAVGSIALDPNAPDTVYVGTGEENFSGDSYYGAGILKSTNDGTSWTQITGPFAPASSTPTYIGAVAVEPGNSQVILAAVGTSGIVGIGQNGYIARTTDGGTSWSTVLTGGNFNNTADAVLFDPTNGSIAYAAVGAQGVYRSIDGGATWTLLAGSGANLFPTSNVGRIAIAIAASSPATLYAAVATTGSSGDLLGLYKTTDSGTNWTQLGNTPDYCGKFHQCWYDITVAVDPVNANVVYSGGEEFTNLFQTLDGGNTWTEVDSVLHPDLHALAFDAAGTVLYVGNDGGVWKTTNVTSSSVSWTNLNATLGITQFYPYLGIHPTNPNILLGGTQDNGSQGYSGSLAWNNVACGDGASGAIDYNNPNNAYTNCNSISIYKSTSGINFFGFNPANTGLNTGDRSAFIPPLVMDPVNPQILYFGTYRLYQTTNGAGNWTAISPDLTTGPGFFGDISSIAAAASNNNVVYVGTHDGKLQVTSNALAGASATWTDSSAGLPGRSVTGISIDPTNAAIVYVTVSGFGAGHVFKSTTSGASWTDISGNLPNTPANAIVIDPQSAANNFYLATDVGVFSTSNGGTTWSTFASGLPNVAVLSLGLQNATRLLFAATHGRGVWNVTLQNTNPATHFQVSGPAGATAGSAFNITVTALDSNNAATVNYPGVVHFTSSDAQAVLPANSTLTNGSGTFSVTLKTAGSQTVTATDTVTSSMNGQATIPVSAAAATHLIVAAPGGATAGAAFTATVTARDTFNNTATGYSGTLHFTASGASSLPVDYTFVAGDSGVHAFTNGLSLNTAGSQTVTATDTVTNTITGNATVAVNPAATAQFSINAPANAAAGVAFNITVMARDGFNNSTPAYSGTVHFTSGDPQAVLPVNSTLVSGVGTFSVTLKTAGPVTVAGSDTVTTSITGMSNTITVSNAAASKYSMTSPPTATAGTPFTVRLVAQDQFNNTAKNYTGTVHFTTNDAAVGVVVPGNYTYVAGDNGQKIFTNGFTLKTIGPKSITATDTVTGSITATNPITVTNDFALTPIARNIRIANARTLIIVASFADSDPAENGSHLSATIDWGDGSAVVPGTIVQVGSTTTFNVLGAHTYTRHGSFTVKVTMTDSQGSISNAFSNARFFPRNISY